MKKQQIFEKRLLDNLLSSQIEKVSRTVQLYCVGNSEIKVYYHFERQQIFTCYNMTYKNSHVVCTFKSIAPIPLDYLIEEITNYFLMQYPSWLNFHNNKNSEFNG